MNDLLDVKNMQTGDANTALKEDYSAVDNPHNKRVLVGMTGGVDSSAAAFLLKKQGFECIGIAIVFINEEKIKEMIIEHTKEEDTTSIFAKKDAEKVELQEKMKFLENSCSAKDLEHIKSVCTQLDIPFYATSAIVEYKDQILDPLIASRLSGEEFNACIRCNNLKLDILYKKAESLKCHYVATGHYAKVYHNKKNNCYQLYAANDMENDQSYLLSTLTQDHLKRLLLPLADVRKQDVIKIKERFQLKSYPVRDSKKICFMNSDLNYFIESYVHESLRPVGSIYHYNDELQICEHSGVYRYALGQKDVKGKEEGVGTQNIDKSLVVVDIDPPGKIFVGEESLLYYSKCAVDRLELTAEPDKSKPMEVYAQHHSGGKRHRGILYFKNNQVGLLEFKEQVFRLVKGQVVVFYDKEGQGGRIIGSGRVACIKNISVVGRTHKLEKEQDKELSDGAETEDKEKSGENRDKNKDSGVNFTF